MAIILLACILVAKKRDQTSAGLAILFHFQFSFAKLYSTKYNTALHSIVSKFILCTHACAV